MQVHKLTILVIDFDDLGYYAVAEQIEKARYANDCISPAVLHSATAEIGPWDDSNPLNKLATRNAEIARLFGGSTQGDV